MYCAKPKYLVSPTSRLPASYLTPKVIWRKKTWMVRARRKELNILPAVKRINTIASEHPELTNYLYMTYATEGYDVNYYKNEKSVVVLGSGCLPHRFVGRIRLVFGQRCANGS